MLRGFNSTHIYLIETKKHTYYTQNGLALSYFYSKIFQQIEPSSLHVPSPLISIMYWAKMKNSRCRCRTLEQNKKQGWKFLNTDCRPDCYTIIKRTLTLLKQTRKQYQEGKQDKYGKIHCHRVGVRLRVGGEFWIQEKKKKSIAQYATDGVWKLDLNRGRQRASSLGELSLPFHLSFSI